jgi:oligosaccharide repeat unit polymerase
MGIARSVLLTEIVQMPIYQRLMANMLYPACVIGAICFVVLRKSLRSWVYLILPAIASLLYAFAFGGRGSIMITGPMVVWIIAVGRREVSGVERWKLSDVLMTVSGIFIVMWFITIMTETRMQSFEVAGSLYSYFIGPIPALSEWLSLHQIPLLDIDLRNLAVIRESARMLGYPYDRLIDYDVAFVPFAFNVFTLLAEQVRDFGILGTMILTTLLGIISSRLEQLPLTVSVLGVRGVFYQYLAFSLFADVAGLVVGWWLALFMVGIVVPLVSHALSKGNLVNGSGPVEATLK